jgi:hypothetical protein
MMRKYLMTFKTFFIFISVGYSQSTILTVVGKKVSVSIAKPVTTSPVDTVTFYTGEKVDTVITVKFIDPVDRATYKVMELISGDFKKDTLLVAINLTLMCFRTDTI